MNPIDKTRTTYLKEFYIILKNGAPERKTRKVFSGSPQWDLESPQCFRSNIPLSYWCRKTNIELSGSSQEKMKKMVTKSRSRVIECN